MRKNYKPHAKQSNLANSYRKKTIDPGVDLNLKKDDDNMENIDDYWDMAEYVMDDDQTLPLKKNIPKEAQELMKKKMPSNNKNNKDASSKSVEKKKDKKQEGMKKDKNSTSKQNSSASQDSKVKDKKKKQEINKKTSSLDKKKPKLDSKYVVESLESSVINDVMDISTDASKLTTEFNKSPKNKNKEKSKQTNPENEESEDTLFDINNIRESLSHSNFKKMSSTSNTSGFDMNYDEVSFNEETKTNKTNKGMKKEKSEKNKKEVEKSKKSTNKDKTLSETKIRDSQPSKTKSVISDSVKRRRSSVSAIESYKGEPLIGKNNKIYGMTKIASLFQGRSKLEPLITKKSLEAGILFLKPGASILQETADNSFTLFLIKGTVEISMDNEKYKLDRESCMLIEKGSSYDIVDKSRSGSSMFVTFKSK